MIPIDDTFAAFMRATEGGDIAVLRKLVAEGFDVRAVDEFGDTVLMAAVSGLERSGDSTQAYRYQVVHALLELGFDPNQRGDEDTSPLTIAMLYMDTEMLRILLEAGARPNEVRGFGETETLYDWAEFDYCYDVWDLGEMPEKPTEAEDATEDSWLGWLDRLAVKHQRRRPDHLFLLRAHGARGRAELDAGIQAGLATPDQDTGSVGSLAGTSTS